MGWKMVFRNIRDIMKYPDFHSQKKKYSTRLERYLLHLECMEYVYSDYILRGNELFTLIMILRYFVRNYLKIFIKEKVFLHS